MAVTHPPSNHLPLKDASVLPANGEQVRVTVSEADVGDVAAVALVLVARCLKRKEAGPLQIRAEEGPSYPTSSSSPLIVFPE